jgi:hypothetical protein
LLSVSSVSPELSGLTELTDSNSERHAFVDVKRRVLCNDLVEACEPFAIVITFA